MAARLCDGGARVSCRRVREESGRDTFVSLAVRRFQPSSSRKTASSSKSFLRRSTGNTPARDCRRSTGMHSAVRTIKPPWLVTRRFAGFYLNEDPAAPNYDPRRKIIKSLFNGSIGPVTRPVTPVDWDGDENPKRAARFSTSSNIRGDHPLNLLAATLATQAYLLTHEAEYKKWVLDTSTRGAIGPQPTVEIFRPTSGSTDRSAVNGEASGTAGYSAGTARTMDFATT